MPSYWLALSSSFASTAVSECGDRTFIASAVLSLKCGDKWIVFWGTFLALATQTLTSTIIGEELKSYLGHASFPWTLLLSTLVFSVFAVHYLYEGVTGIRNLKGKPTDLTQHLINDDDVSSTKSFTDRTTSRSRLFWEVFALIYITEIGDTSMVAQTALASQLDFICVFVGACIANAVVNGVGIFFGHAVSDKIDVQVVNIVAGLLFVTYGAFSAYDLLNALA